MKRVIEKVSATNQPFITAVESEDHHWYLLRVLPYNNIKTESGQILITFVDISPQKKIEQELVEQKEEAEAANKAKSQFLSQMSHELRTPLNAILGFTQLLQNDTSNNSDAEMLSLIRSAGNQLLSLINELLDLSHIESGKLSIESSECSITDIIESCVALTSSMTDQHGVTLGTHIDEELLELKLTTDRKRLKQVIINFVSNAIKYGKKNGHVELNVKLADKDTVLFLVKDEGDGLTDEQQIKIFNEFERLHHTNSNIEGSGIGLSICKRIVVDLGGEIGVDSSPGEGSTFWVKLPLKRKKAATPSQPETPRTPIKKENRANFDSNTKKILYIEDNLHSAQIVSKMLSSTEIDVDVVGTAHDALDYLSDNEVDLLLIDLNLPDMTGTSFYDQLSRSLPHQKHIPAVMVSSSFLPAQIEEARKHGILDYISKPIERSRLISIISKHLHLNSD